MSQDASDKLPIADNAAHLDVARRAKGVVIRVGRALLEKALLAGCNLRTHTWRCCLSRVRATAEDDGACD